MTIFRSGNHSETRRRTRRVLVQALRNDRKHAYTQTRGGILEGREAIRLKKETQSEVLTGYFCKGLGRH